LIRPTATVEVASNTFEPQSLSLVKTEPRTEPEQGPAKPRARIEPLADLIFGLALSVGAISVVSNPPTDVQAVYNDLATFGFSSLILITMWLRYTRIMSVFPIETRRVNNLNVLLLFCVSIEPFLFNLVRNMPAVTDPNAFADATSALYALDLGAMFAILGGFSLTLANEERKLIQKALTRQYRVEGATTIACGLISASRLCPSSTRQPSGTGNPSGTISGPSPCFFSGSLGLETACRWPRTIRHRSWLEP